MRARRLARPLVPLSPFGGARRTVSAFGGLWRREMRGNGSWLRRATLLVLVVAFPDRLYEYVKNAFGMIIGTLSPFISSFVAKLAFNKCGKY